MHKCIVLLFLLSFPLLSAEAPLPGGSWICADSSWEYIEVFSVGPDDQVIRMVRGITDSGRLEYRYQEGNLISGDHPRFTAEETFVLTEGEAGLTQKRISEHTDVLVENGAVTNGCLKIGSRCCQSSREVVSQALSGELEVAEQFIPLVNMSIYALQSRIQGFGTEDMTAYWRKEESFSGLSGTAAVTMRSSGRVLFLFPKLPVMFDMVFDSFSVIDGLVITGYQTIVSENRRGDGYLYGALEIEGAAEVIYGQEDGTDVVLIKEGTVAGGTLEVLTRGRRYLVDAAVRQR